MSQLFASGRIIDLILLILAMEVIVLRRLRHRDLLGQVAAGALLLLALRFALRGADYRWTALFLTASFPAHLYDLRRRWFRSAASSPSSARQRA